MGAMEESAAFPFRIRQIEKVLEDYRTWRGKVDTERAVQKEQLMTLDHRMEELTKSVDSLRKVILGFALSVAGSAIVFALSILIATGKIGHG